MSEPITLDEASGSPSEGRAAARRVSWGVVDQAVSSLTNFALGIVVARAVGLSEFGAFGVALAVAAVSLEVNRALGPEPLAIRFAVAELAERRRAMQKVSALSLALGIAVAVPVALAGLVATGELRSALLALAPWLPGLVLQDAWRVLFIADGRPKAALVNDLTWTAVQLPLLAWIWMQGRVSIGSAVGAWGLAATVAAAAGFAQAGHAPDARGAVRWVGEQRRIWPGLVVDNLARSGVLNVVLVIVGGITGLAGMGALRGALTLLGPLNLVFLMAPVIGVPEGAKLRDRSEAGFRRAMGGIAASLGVAAAVWTAALLVTPDSWGSALLGDTWPTARGVLLAMGAMFCARGIGVGAQVGMRVLAAVKRSAIIRVGVSPLLVAGGVGGALVAGAPGAATGLALAMGAGTVAWWWGFATSVREGSPA